MTLEEFTEKVVESLKTSYRLYYPDYGHELDSDGIRAILTDDDDAWTSYWEGISDWESDTMWDAARQLANDAAYDVAHGMIRTIGEDEAEALLQEWDGSQGWYEVIDIIRDRDDGIWFEEIIRNTRDQVVRFLLVDEDSAPGPPGDDGYGHDDIVAILQSCGLPVTMNNVSLMAELICNTPSEVRMIQVLAGVDLIDLYQLHKKAGESHLPLERVVIEKPFLLMGNLYAGAYWLQGPFDGSITVERCRLTRDEEDAEGYSWYTCVGGYSPGEYLCDLAAAATPEQIEAAVASIHADMPAVDVGDGRYAQPHTEKKAS